MIYIYHHLGLGDHIICNGLVRTLIKKDEQYMMFVKPHNLPSVKFMYRDLKNLDFIVGDDLFVKNFLTKNNIPKEKIIIAGFYKHPKSLEFDDSFYLQNSIPFETRWTNFYVERDLESEKKIFKNYNVKNNQYVFIHDDFERNIRIDENYIVNKNLPIVRPKKGLTNNIFDYCYLMDNSRELHFIDSSFRLIYDSIFVKDKDIFYHLNYKSVIRDTTTKSQSKNNFKII